MRQDGRQHPATLARCVATWEMPGRKPKVGESVPRSSPHRSTRRAASRYSGRVQQRTLTATSMSYRPHSPWLGQQPTAQHRRQFGTKRPIAGRVGHSWDATQQVIEPTSVTAGHGSKADLSCGDLKTVPYAWRTYEDQEAAGLGACRLTDLLTNETGRNRADDVRRWRRSARPSPSQRDVPERRRRGDACRIAHNPEVEGSNSSPYQGQRPFLEQRKGLLHVVCKLTCARLPACEHLRASTSARVV